MELIKNNPYRIVGLLVGTSLRDLTKKIARLKQYVEAEQEVPDDYSFPILGNLKRTAESVESASLKLNLNNDKIVSALFWFYSGSHVDEPAFDMLKDEKIENTIAVWEKLVNAGEISERNASSYCNLGTIKLNSAFDGKDVSLLLLEEGINLKLKYLESPSFKSIVKMATDETYRTTKEELQNLFLNNIQSEIENHGGVSIDKFIEIVNRIDFSAKQDYLKGFVENHILQIQKMIEECKRIRKSNPESAVNAGNTLFESTKNELSQLKRILNSNDIKLSSINDKVSDEILQCGIDHYKHFRDTNTDPGNSSMDLFRKANSLAIGNVTKQRCQENSENLQDWIDNKAERDLQRKAGAEIEFIIESLNLASATLKNNGKYPRGYNDPYSKLPKSEQPQNKIFSPYDETNPFHETLLISMGMSGKKEFNINLFRLARDIVKECSPKLAKMKEVAGSSNEIYLKLSNDLASLAMACLINFVNNSANPDFNIPPDVDENVIKAMDAIGYLDMDTDMRKRYAEQKKSLYNLNRAINKRNNKSTGCYIATMVYGDYEHPQVKILRKFRDTILSSSYSGRTFIKFYYSTSPHLVKMLKNNSTVNLIIRKILDQIIKIISK